MRPGLNVRNTECSGCKMWETLTGLQCLEDGECTCRSLSGFARRSNDVKVSSVNDNELAHSCQSVVLKYDPSRSKKKKHESLQLARLSVTVLHCTLALALVSHTIRYNLHSATLLDTEGTSTHTMLVVIGTQGAVQAQDK